MRIYLDHNATSPLKESARQAMLAALALAGNASSIHAEGREAHALLDQARDDVACSLGVVAPMVVFTSGGSEANNLALKGVPAERLVVSAVEHPSVLEAARAAGRPVEILPVDGRGLIDLAALRSLLETGPRALVSVMLANNETGVVQPVREIASLAHAHGALVHTDAVQALGKIPVNFGLLAVDLLSVSAHKLGGPIGAGALVVRDGLVLAPLVHGGGQELRRRAGTENLAAIAGFAAAAREKRLEIKALRDHLERGLEGAVIFGAEAERLPNTSCFALPGLSAETLLMALDLAGFAVSSGSACSSGKVAKSHVLAAMGVAPALAGAAIRVSLGWTTTAEDVEQFISAWRRIGARRNAA
ncbi:MAG: cysteine desulfurase family protein [Parvibaculaceae bacterium]